MDVTLLELHLHDSAIDFGGEPPAGRQDSHASDADHGATEGSGSSAAIPVVLGLLLLVALVARRVLRAAASEDV